MSHLQLPKTLALFGRKSSGKSWLATKLQQEHGYTILNFADCLKDLTCSIYNISHEQLEMAKNDSSQELQFDITKEKVQHILGITVKQSDYDNLIQLKSARQILQFLGTDILQKHNKNYFINIIHDKVKDLYRIDPDVKLVFADCRFLSEQYFVEQVLKGVSVFIVNPTCNKISNHISEREIQFQMCNYIVVNNMQPTFWELFTTKLQEPFQEPNMKKLSTLSAQQSYALGVFNQMGCFIHKQGIVQFKLYHNNPKQRGIVSQITNVIDQAFYNQTSYPSSSNNCTVVQITDPLIIENLKLCGIHDKSFPIPLQLLNETDSVKGSQMTKLFFKGLVDSLHDKLYQKEILVSLHNDLVQLLPQNVVKFVRTCEVSDKSIVSIDVTNILFWCKM